MTDKCHALRGLLIAALLPVAFGGKTESAGSTLIEQTLETIQNCMARSPAPWPNEWKQKYIDTIRSALQQHQDASQCDMKLEILRNAFAPYWDSFKKTADRSLFEVHRTRIRWYVEHLMGSEFPTEQERQKLRDQYKEIWDYAASSLLTQFPFLDPNTVQKAKADDLSICYLKIDAPLMPVYLCPFSEEQVAQVKKRWDELRYARVDLWRSLQDNSTTPLGKSDVPSSNAKRDYELTKKSLSNLLGLVWIVIPQRPDYYLIALENRSKALRQRVQSKQAYLLQYGSPEAWLFAGRS